MPTPTKYTKSLATDFGGSFYLPHWLAEIEASSIVTQIDHAAGGVTVSGDVIDTWFKNALSAGDQTTFDGLPGSHDGTAPGVPADMPVAVQNKAEVTVRKPDGLVHDRVYGFSINFCDKTTWYHDAAKVADEATGTGDGVTTAFQLGRGTASTSPDAADERIVDLGHGKLSDENDIPNTDGQYRNLGSGFVTWDPQTDPGGTTCPLSGFVPLVKVDGVEQTEGTDYTIDYVTGALTFTVAPGNTLAITTTYWYVPKTGCACILLVPPAGMRYNVERVEIQSTSDVELNADINMNVKGGAAPPNGVSVRRPTVVKNLYDIVNWAHGSFAQIPAQGGAGSRGLPLAVNIHRVEYVSEVPLLSSQLMYMEVALAPDANGVTQEYVGTWATVVIYGMAETEA